MSVEKAQSQRGNERNSFFNGLGVTSFVAMTDYFLSIQLKNDYGQPVFICVLSSLVWSLGIQIWQVIHSLFEGRFFPFSFCFHLLSRKITLLIAPFLFSFFPT